jgi:oxygen-independent coproporphyrinogen-3 oxidase
MLTPFSEPRSAYVHVPFCAHRCGYCDFTLVARKDHLIGDYLRALELELSRLETPREVDTLFLGGGTPTHLEAKQLRTLLQTVRSWLMLAEGGEFSIEANPYGLTSEKIDVLMEAGVNRVSLGVQSFSAPLLQTLERDHREPDILSAFERLRSRMDNIAIDLIFAVPGQSLNDWRDTLERTEALGPKHVSTYGLTYEKGTAFWTRRSKGQLAAAGEDLELAMYELAMEFLPARGYPQCELSNFAQPGFECRHNEVYWAGLPYFGFGPGAASYVRGIRRTNHRSVTTWLARVLAGESGVGAEETLSVEERAREAVMLGLRRTAGIDRATFRERFEIDLDGLAGDTISRFVGSGLLGDDGASIRLTPMGRTLADTVVAEFL